MPTLILAAALMLQAVPAPPSAEAPVISQENRALLRCAAAFALVSAGQARGEADASRWPTLGLRGREFFVRALAQVMDATQLDRDGIAALAEAEARALSANGDVGKIMPSCLLMLEASGV